jgi:hypothetical protein
MIGFHPEDWGCPTVLSKRGDASLQPGFCSTLSEAAIEVANWWLESERHKAQFEMIGGGPFHGLTFGRTS